MAPGTRVVLNPGTGWVSDPHGPESPNGYAILGGTGLNPIGTAVSTLAIHKDEAFPCPAHLTSEEAAALPLTGLTAWRAFATKSNAAFSGANILITGIGGGVACAALQFAVAKGVRVWVTSSAVAKIDAAKKFGAQDGISYIEIDWEKKLQKMLPKDRPFLDAVIDGAGGDLMTKAVRLLKPGGVVSCYGMTVAPKMSIPMQAVLKNIEFHGSTMGSRDEFAEMLKFVDKHKIRPIVSKVVKGSLDEMDKWEELFDEMKTGGQMGKLVFAIQGSGKASWEEGRGYGRASGAKL
jgi:NADPH:quinone reductase-like Zn-dependent oxidoreductase